MTDPKSPRTSDISWGTETAPLASAFGVDDLDLSDLDGPLYWPGVPGEQAARKWAELRRWVERLIERFDLDYHSVPRCWYRHNNIVEALAALRDHERGSYSSMSTATAAVEWHRAFRDVEARLREWTGRLACGAHHEAPTMRPPIAVHEWDGWVTVDTAARRERSIAEALNSESPNASNEVPS